MVLELWSDKHTNRKTEITTLYTYTLLVCLLVGLHPIKVKTAEPNESENFEIIHMTQRKVYGLSRQFTWHRGRFMSSRDISHNPEEGLWLVETIHMTQRKVYVFSRQFTWHRGRFMSSRDISHNPEEGLCLVEIIHMTQRKVYVFSRQFTWHIGKVYGLLRQSTWPRGRFMACRDNSHDTWGRFMACRDNWHDQEEGLCLVETIISI